MSAANHVDLLRERALQEPDKLAFTFLPAGEQEGRRITFSELHRRARAIAARLRLEGAEGKPVLLLFPSGLEFIEAFFGCLYSGAIPTPSHLPRLNRSLSRMRGIVENANPAAVLATTEVRRRLAPAIGETGLGGLPWIASEEAGEEAAVEWSGPAVRPETPALLQYTSGSTSAPRGILVTHGNLFANHRMLQSAFGQTADSTIVSWLPLFHDMGLIGKALQALYLGAHCVLMPPEAFLVKPVRWLQAISRYRGHTSGAPNFAFDHCCRMVKPEQRIGLDLGSWEVAFNGAEPVRAGTLENFAAAFACCGFRKSALLPVYGMAEATLFVSGGASGAAPAPISFDIEALLSGEAIERDGERGRSLAGCGHTWLEQEIVIADPVTREECPSGKVGEIWVAGPNVAQGIWNQPEATERDFHARLAGGDGKRFLRTGDTGFFYNGELFIAGRLKDLIIIAGRNHDPADIEQTVEKSHPAVRAGCCAAFPVEMEGERLVIVAEVARQEKEFTAVARAIRHAVAEAHDLSVHAVELLPPGRVPKTTSGKIRRRACRAEYLAGMQPAEEACVES